MNRTIEEKVSFQSNNVAIAGIFKKPIGTSRPPVLIICHAYGEGKEAYAELTEALEQQGIATLVFDFHGHGESGGPRFHLKMSDWKQDVHEAVNWLSRRQDIDLNRIGGFGFSSGGTVLLETALEEPRLKTLILQDATTRNSLPAIGNIIIRMLCGVGKITEKLTGKEVRIPLSAFAKLVPFADDPDVNKSIIERLQKRGHYWALPGGEAAFFVDTIKRVPQIKQPTLVIWGEKDQVDAVESGQMLYDRLTSEKKLVVIPGNGHAGHLDRNKQQVFDLTAEWARTHL